MAAAYIPSQNFIDTSELKKLISLHPISQFIIGGDYNAKHTSWNNRRNNNNVNTLRNFIDKNPINLLYPNSPTHITNRSSSVIDIFLTNITVLSKCKVPNDLSSSHLLVILDIDTRSPISLFKKISTTDWDKYKELCKDYIIIQSLTSTDDRVSEISCLNNKINSAYHKATIVSFKTDKSTSFIPEIQRDIKSRNKARRKFQKTNNIYYKLLKNISTRRINNLINNAKIEQWKVKISNLNIQDQSLWNYYKIKTKAKTPIPPLTNPKSNLLFDDFKKADLLADIFQEVHTVVATPFSPHEELSSQLAHKISQSTHSYDYQDLSPQFYFSELYTS